MWLTRPENDTFVHDNITFFKCELFYKQVFPGNRDRNTPVGSVLNPPIVARHIKVHPKTWNGFISMRVELYGCREGESI